MAVIRKLAFWIAGILVALRLLAAALPGAHDFEVYWNVGRFWLEGLSPYGSAIRAGWVVKYPPWFLPIFFPFGFFSFPVANFLWALSELAAIGYALWRLRRVGIGWPSLTVAFMGLWWIWLGHFYAGQIYLLLLAAALAPPRFLPVTLSVWSAKVFTLVAFIGRWRELKKASLFTLALVIPLYGLASTRISPLALWNDFIHNASTIVEVLGKEHLRGQMNHGFPAVVMRLLPTSTSTIWDIGAFVFCASVTSVLWLRFSRRLGAEERWSGWMALACVVHPSAWHHSFVLVYPLCAHSLSRAWASRSRFLICMCLAGIACIGLLLPQTLGVAGARPLELAGIKSWGVVLCAIALVKAPRESAT